MSNPSTLSPTSTHQWTKKRLEPSHHRTLHSLSFSPTAAATKPMDSHDWLLTALQSSDEDVASHALLLLWKRVKQDHAQGLTSLLIVDMAARPWRRLGLLLFADDPLTVRAVVSMITSLTKAEDKDEVCEQSSAARRRVWQSDWRQFIIDKLTDCHSRACTTASKTSQSKSTGHQDLEVAMRLVLVLRVVLMNALRMGEATTKDQARMVDLLVELAASTVDTIACVSLATLSSLLRSGKTSSEPALDPQVFLYVEASRVFVDSLHWLSERIAVDHVQGHQRVGGRLITQHTRVLTRRYQLTLSLLVDGAKQSTEIAVSLARDPSLFLQVCLGIVEIPRHSAIGCDSLHARPMQLLEAVLSHDVPQTTEIVSQLRLNGGLITLSWLQAHRSTDVQEATARVFSYIIRASPSSDLLRAFIEQGCVVVSYLQRGDASTNSQILQWVVDTLEGTGPQLTHAIAQSVLRSTNHKLQRNVILALLLLSQSSDTIHNELFSKDSHDDDTFLDGIVRAAIHTNDDGSLATSLLAMAVVFADKQSTLRIDHSSKITVHRGSSQRDLAGMANSASAPRGIVELVCADSVVISVKAALLTQECKVVRRQFESLAGASLSGSTSDSVVVDLREFDAATVQLFVQLLGITAPQVATKLQPFNLSHIESLFTLSRRLESAKCWHAATLATSHALQSAAIDWKLVLDLAVSHRHPALMLRAIRIGLNERAKPHAVESRANEIHEAALTIWREYCA